jgi:transcriptional regulator with XRE-family HTH domain
MNESILDRIIRLVEEKSMKDNLFCDLSGISTSTYGNWKKRGTIPNGKHIARIAEVLDVSEKYLTTGEELDVIEDVAIEMSKRPELEELFRAAKYATRDQIDSVTALLNSFKK